MLRASHIHVDNTSRDVCVMFASMACGSFVDAEIYTRTWECRDMEFLLECSEFNTRTEISYL